MGLARAGTRFAPGPLVFAFLAPAAPPPTALAEERPSFVESTSPAAADERFGSDVGETPAKKSDRDRWLLALEGVVRAPSDIGVQGGVEFPFRLRLFTGFGYMPIDWVTGFVADATPNREARAVLALPSYAGTIWRIQAGVRPFRRLGFYADAGYARANISGTFTPSRSLTEEFDIDFAGGFEVNSSLNLWLVELGHEWIIARHGVVALGLGVMSTFDANTNISMTGGGERPPELAEGERTADDALESYGTIPFITLRVGVDFL